MSHRPSTVDEDGVITIWGHQGAPHNDIEWSMEIVLEKPTCTICDTRKHPITAFVLHSGQPICSGCVAEYVDMDQRS